MTRKLWIAGTLSWTLVVTVLRAARLPNDFAKEHWLIDYRFGFVKRGLVGAILSLITRLFRTRATDHLVNLLSTVLFAGFCGVLLWLTLHVIRRSGWSTPVTLAVLAFLSSPFIVMSAHLVGYYDNIIVGLAILSLALLFSGRVWSAVLIQTAAILVHENALLIGFPVLCWSWWLVGAARRPSPAGRLPLWPLLLPIAAFLAIVASQRLASRDLEQLLMGHLSTYPFIAARLGDVRVPHWITISFYDSYLLHQGQFLGRALSQGMIGVVVPSLLAILGIVFETGGIGVLSMETLVVLGACLAAQTTHVMAWDTSRIWTYSILCAFLLLWTYIEVSPAPQPAAPFVRLLCLIALFLNAVDVTPLMDGLKEHFDLTTRLMLYAPVLASALALMWTDGPRGALNVVSSGTVHAGRDL